MKIGVIVDNDLQADVRVLKEIQMAKNLGNEVVVLCFGYDGYSYEPLNFKVNRIKISKKRKEFLFILNLVTPFYERLWTKEVSQFLKSEQVDLLHVHDLYMSKSVKKAVDITNLRVPIALDLHENFPSTYKTYGWTNKRLFKIVTRPNHWKYLEEEYLSYADGLILLSKFFEKKLENQYDSLKDKKKFILPNVPDISVFDPPEPMKRSEKVTFIYFGIVAKRRGLFDVLEVLRELKEERYDFKLLVIGPIDKSDKKLFDFYKEKLSPDILEHIPWITIGKLTTYMKISDVALCPIHVNEQHESGVANKVFQYMYGELPIIASNCRPQRKIIEDYNIGFVFDNMRELKKHISYCLSNRTELLEMGQRARYTLLRYYQMESFEEGLDHFYSSLLIESSKLE